MISLSNNMVGVINNINKAHWLTGKVHSDAKMEQRLISSLKYIYALCCNKSNGRLQKKVYCQMYQQLNGIVQVLLLHHWSTAEICSDVKA